MKFKVGDKVKVYGSEGVVVSKAGREVVVRMDLDGKALIFTRRTDGKYSEKGVLGSIFHLELV